MIDKRVVRSGTRVRRACKRRTSAQTTLLLGPREQEVPVVQYAIEVTDGAQHLQQISGNNNKGAVINRLATACLLNGVHDVEPPLAISRVHESPRIVKNRQNAKLCGSLRLLSNLVQVFHCIKFA